MRRGNHLLRMLSAATVACLLCGGILWSPPSAATESRQVSRIMFAQTLTDRTTATVEVSFDRPVDSAVAADAQGSLGVKQVIEHLNLERLGCSQELAKSDTNGQWRLRYACFPEYAVLNWDYRLSPAAQATVVGLITERGLSWWRNGIEQLQSTGHPQELAIYRFHGVMKKVWNGDVLDYQDYISWRHNIGPGGRAAVTFAGSVEVG